MHPKQFIFEGYNFDEQKLEAAFTYSFDGELHFTEKVRFADIKPDYNKAVFDSAMRLAFYVIGTSYYKAFPQAKIVLKEPIDAWQAAFLNTVYQEGLSQFAYENNLTRHQLATFTPGTTGSHPNHSYSGEGIIALQSGGKDSLLVGSLLNHKKVSFSSLFVTSSESYPSVIGDLKNPVLLLDRIIDKQALIRAKQLGALNGHVPVTYIIASQALLQGVLQNKKTILLAIGHEGEEPHHVVGNLPIMHQWSKTWHAEKQLAQYVDRYVSKDIQLGSPLRQYSELKIAELFAVHAWTRFGRTFSSCNVANYRQGQSNQQLKWCADCPKCANSFLLFAPFVPPQELMALFDGQNLFEKETLRDIFKGLLGIDNVMKPFECVGEVEELRLAYHMARQKWGEQTYALPFAVPAANFDYEKTYESQEWARQLAQGLV